MKYTKILLIFFATLLLTSIIGGVYFFISKNGELKTVQPFNISENQNNKSGKVVNGKRTYKNDKYGFAFEYPERFGITEKETSDGVETYVENCGWEIDIYNCDRLIMVGYSENTVENNIDNVITNIYPKDNFRMHKIEDTIRPEQLKSSGMKVTITYRGGGPTDIYSFVRDPRNQKQSLIINLSDNTSISAIGNPEKFIAELREVMNSIKME